MHLVPVASLSNHRAQTLLSPCTLLDVQADREVTALDVLAARVPTAPAGGGTVDPDASLQPQVSTAPLKCTPSICLRFHTAICPRLLSTSPKSVPMSASNCVVVTRQDVFIRNSRCASAAQGNSISSNCQADMPALSSPTAPADQPGRPVAEPAVAARLSAGQPAALSAAQHSKEADEPSDECMMMAQGAKCPDASRPGAPPPAVHAGAAGAPAAQRPAEAQDAACLEVSSPALSLAELGSGASTMLPAAHPAAVLAAACLPGSQPASPPAETAATNATAPAAEQPTPQLHAACPDASQHTPPTLQQETATNDNRVRVRITFGWPPLALPPATAETQLRMQARLLVCWQSVLPSDLSLSYAASHALLSHAK